MSEYIELLNEAQKQIDEEKFTPSVNKLINAVLEYDRNIKTVAIIVNGRSVRQNDFNASVIDVLDIYDNDSKKSINEEVSKVLEQNKYETDRLIISEAMKNKLKRNNAVIFIESESIEVKRGKDVIITHRWKLINSK